MWVNRERYEKEQKLLRIINLAFPMAIENAKRLVDGDYPTEKAVIILRNELGGINMRPSRRRGARMTNQEAIKTEDVINAFRDYGVEFYERRTSNEDNQTELRDPDTDS